MLALHIKDYQKYRDQTT